MIKSVLILALVLSIGLPSAQSAYACAESDIQHWMQVGFFTAGPGNTVKFIHDTLPDIVGNTNYSVEMQYDPLVSTDVIAALIDELDNLGYTEPDGSPPEASAINTIRNPNYSTICGDFLSQIVGGFLLEPNVGALLLAYGIMNAFWMAPIGLGIGVGVYLIKRRF